MLYGILHFARTESCALPLQTTGPTPSEHRASRRRAAAVTAAAGEPPVQRWAATSVADASATASQSTEACRKHPHPRRGVVGPPKGAGPRRAGHERAAGAALGCGDGSGDTATEGRRLDAPAGGRTSIGSSGALFALANLPEDSPSLTEEDSEPLEISP
jgi:hypothetical protein